MLPPGLFPGTVHLLKRWARASCANALLPQDSQKEADGTWFDTNRSCFPHVHPHTHMCTHTLSHTYTSLCMHAHTSIRICIRSHTYAETCMHTHTQAHMTCSRSHTYTHSHFCVPRGQDRSQNVFPPCKTQQFWKSDGGAGEWKVGGRERALLNSVQVHPAESLIDPGACCLP